MYIYIYISENHFLLISSKRYENKSDIIAIIEKPINIPNVPPTELMSPRKSNKRYSS